jgi:hypothetical protein
MGQIIQQTPAQMAQAARLNREIANLPPDVRAQIGENYANSQIAVLPLPYWSTVRFQAAVAAGPPVVYTIDTTTRQAFSYAQGQAMTGAGFLAAYGNATPAETNLLRAQETRDNADVWIWGIACYLSQDSEPALARKVWRDTSVSIALNGTQSIPLGTLEMFPSGGGLYGTAVSAIKQPDLGTPGGGTTENGSGALMPFANNGNPIASSFFRLQQPFKWSAVGTAGADSSLNIGFTPQRTITETAGLVRAAAAGVSAFTPPGTAGILGTYVDIRVRLVCVSVAKRSVNV